jgi:putative peptidyl-prolyl cis-trans isomerase
MKRLILLLILSASAAIPSRPSGAWEKYDSVIAVVNDRAIIASELDSKFLFLQRSKNIPQSRISFEKSRLLDQFIEDALVAQTADESSIIVSDKKVLNRIQPMLRQYLSKHVTKQKEMDDLVFRCEEQMLALVEADRSLKKGPKIEARLKGFLEQLEKTQNEPFLEFFETARTQIRRQDVISISLGVTPPSEKEAMDWFRSNRAKLGYEMWLKHILIIPKGSSFAAEKEANTLLSSIRTRIQNGESFEKLAAQYSDDPGSKAKGGDIGWVMPAELDPYFAGNVFNSYRQNGITSVFKSGFGYHIVKYIGRRDVTFEKVQPMIMQKLYYEKNAEQFKKWVADKKSTSEIKIYMDSYIKG